MDSNFTLLIIILIRKYMTQLLIPSLIASKRFIGFLNN